MKTTCQLKIIYENYVFANEMTQQQLAKNAGVSRQTIIAIEAGKYSPSLELAFKIASIFNVEIGEVFEYDANT